jgi:hypothetical protein
MLSVGACSCSVLLDHTSKRCRGCPPFLAWDRQTLLDLEVNHNISTPLVVFAALSLSVEIYQPNIVICANEMYEVKSARLQCHTNDNRIPRYPPSSQQRGS